MWKSTVPLDKRTRSQLKVSIRNFRHLGRYPRRRHRSINNLHNVDNKFEFDVSKVIQPGKDNILTVKITPERAIPRIVPGDPIRVEGPVELGDTWLDWLNWKYIGVEDPATGFGFSFPPDRNAGVWKRVYLSTTGPVSIRNPYVATDLPLPATNPASLTVYCDLTNHRSRPVSGVLTGEITRDGKPAIRFEQPV